MKVFTLGILLVSLCCIEGAVVKREAEGQAPEAPPAEPSISRYFQEFADYFKGDALSNYATQTRNFFQQLHEQILNEQVTDRLGQVFHTAVESAKKAMQ